jgi:hypothetical protein
MLKSLRLDKAYSSFQAVNWILDNLNTGRAKHSDPLLKYSMTRTLLTDWKKKEKRKMTPPDINEEINFGRGACLVYKYVDN